MDTTAATPLQNLGSLREEVRAEMWEAMREEVRGQLQESMREEVREELRESMREELERLKKGNAPHLGKAPTKTATGDSDVAICSVGRFLLLYLP